MLTTFILAELPETCEPLPDGRRPKVAPQWFHNLRDMNMTFGGPDLLYYLGNPISVYKDPMTVSVTFAPSLNSNATVYNQTTNTIEILSSKLQPNETGYHHIDI